MRSLNSKNINQKLGKIRNVNYKDLQFGNSLVHAALDGTIKDSELLLHILEELFNRGASIDEPNYDQNLPIHFAVTNDIFEAVNWILEKNPNIVNNIHSITRMSLFHHAVTEYAFQSIHVLHRYNPGLVNLTIMDGTFYEYAPINLFLAIIVSKLDVHVDQFLQILPQEVDHEVREQYESGKREPVQNIVEDNDTIKIILDFLIKHSPYSSFILPTKFGTVIHQMVRISYFKGIEMLKLKTTSEQWKELLEAKDGENRSALFCSLERSTQMYKAARILLDNGADANEVLVTEYRQAAIEGEKTIPRGRKTRPISTMERLMRTANEKEKCLDLVEKLLSKLQDFEESIEWILDDSSLSFKLLKIVLKEAEIRGKDVSALINGSYRENSLTAIHMLLSSNLISDIEEELDFLLEHGGDVLVKANNEQFRNELLPVHIASSLQFSFDKKEDIENGFGHGEFGKERLDQYLRCISRYEVNKLLNGRSQSYIESFLKHHLIPGVYAANHPFVHQLISQFYKLPLCSQHKIIHFRCHNDIPNGFNYQMYDKTVLYWATRQSQQSILSEIVRALFNVYNTKSKKKSSKPPGVECFEQLEETYYKTQAIRLYLDLFEPERHWYNNIFSAIIQILLLCYAFFIYDLYLDIELIMAYRDQERLITSFGYFTDNSTNLTIQEDPENYKIARYFSIGLILPSLIAYLLLTWFKFDVPQRLLVSNHPSWNFFMKIFNPIVFPATYFLRQIRTETYPNSYGKSQRFEDCRTIWMTVRRVETGVESVGQLILQLWLFGPFVRLMKAWSTQEVFKHVWSGLGHVVSFTIAEATFIEKMLAKFCLSTFLACGSVTFIRVSKPSDTGMGSLPSITLFFTSCLLEMVARFMTLQLLFMINIDKNFHFMCILAHVLIELVIKVTFEWPKITTRSITSVVEMLIKSLIGSSCSLLVFLNTLRSEAAKGAKDNNLKNTFFPITIHLMVCLIEQTILIYIPTPEEKSWTLQFIPYILLTFSISLMILYYKVFHPASILNANGPKILPNDSALCICSTLFCCQMQTCIVPRGYQKVRASGKSGSNHVHWNGTIPESEQSLNIVV